MSNNKKKKQVVTLQHVYDIIQKWLFFPHTERIDVILAVVLSLFYDGNPLWLFIIGRSGDAKTEIIKALDGLPFIRRIDQITANTFASGRKDAKDLGSELTGKRTILLFTDLACLISLNKDEKKKIWSQFRTLYDGDIYKDTGSGCDKPKYKNCHVIVIACVTRVIKEEHHIHQQLGTRELLFDTNAEFNDNLAKMKQVYRNTGRRNQMRTELKDIIQGFIKTHRFDNTITIPEDVLDYIYTRCQKLTILRATAAVDWYSGELDGDADTEVPTRLSEQFMVLYKALHSLSQNYDDSRFKTIIENIVRSSSHPVRYKLYQIFKDNENPGEAFTIRDLMRITRLGKKAVTSQCEILWNLGSLEKETKEEIVGEMVKTARDGTEYTSGGHLERIDYYRMRRNKKTGQQGETP